MQLYQLEFGVSILKSLFAISAVLNGFTANEVSFVHLVPLGICSSRVTWVLHIKLCLYFKKSQEQ